MDKALDVLHRLFEKGNSPLARDFQRYQLSQNWEKVVGKTVAEVSSPLYVSQGILYIWVKSGPWMNQLFYARSEILEQVKKYLNNDWVKTLRFTLRKPGESAAESWKAGPQGNPSP